MISWGRYVIHREMVLLGLSFLLGALTPLAFSPWRTCETGYRRWIPWLWSGCSLAVLGVCLAFAWQELPSIGGLLLPFACCLAGIRVGSAAHFGYRPFLWAIGQLALLLLLLVTAGLMLTRSVAAAQPLEFDASELSMDDKRTLAQRIRNSRSPDDRPREVRLTDTEINALMRSLVRRGNIPHQASVHFEPRTWRARSSWAIPKHGDRRYVNIRSQGILEIRNGDLQLTLEELSVGQWSLPSPFLWLLAHSARAMLLDEPQVRQVIKSIDRLAIEPATIDLVFEPGTVSRQLVPSIVNLLWSRPDVSAETRVYLAQLLSTQDQLPAGELRFGQLMQAAFSLAAQRSEIADPQLENQAAIFALAILWGHSDLEPFVGEVLDPELRAQAEPMAGTISLHGRCDLPRHFLVSAALLLLSDEVTSDWIGKLKEKIDAQDGGSGFSFVDVVANMAGNRFADAATRDSLAARAVQRRLSQEFDVNKLFPSFEGLPENITASELQNRYGGVRGPGFREWMNEIEQRFDALADPFLDSNAEKWH